MTARHKQGDDEQDGLIQIHFRLRREEHPALFDYLARCPKGIGRTCCLKLLAHDGLRHIQQMAHADIGQRVTAHASIDLPVPESTPWLTNRPADADPSERETAGVHNVADQMGGPPGGDAGPLDASTIGLAAQIFGPPAESLDIPGRLRRAPR